MFSASPPPTAARAAAPPLPALKPSSIVLEPANPVEAFIGEMALAIQKGPFHRFFQQLGQPADATADPTPPAMTGPPELYVFSAEQTVPLGVRASARLDARKTSRRVQPGDQLLVARVFVANGVGASRRFRHERSNAF